MIYYYFGRHLGFWPLQPLRAKIGLDNIEIRIQWSFLPLGTHVVPCLKKLCWSWLFRKCPPVYYVAKIPGRNHSSINFCVSISRDHLAEVEGRLWNEKYLLDLYYLCFEVSAFGACPTLRDTLINSFLGGGGAGEIRSPPNWVTRSRMVSKMSAQFVLLVLPSFRICAPILHALFWKQVWRSCGNVAPSPKLSYVVGNGVKIGSWFVLSALPSPRICTLTLYPLFWTRVWEGRGKFKRDYNWWQWITKSNSSA